MPKRPTKAEKERMAKVSQLPCCICGKNDVEVPQKNNDKGYL